VKYLLDTNIVSMLDPRRHAHAPALIDWLDRNGASLFLSVMTIVEVDAGILKLRREGKAERAHSTDRPAGPHHCSNRCPSRTCLAETQYERARPASLA
jgi:predicted nucleic acid-binding protein